MRVTSLFLVLLTCRLAAAGAPPIERPGENLAAGRPYTLSPRPNYRYCTDPDDRVQLTDGQYTKGHFWTQKSTVGWNHSSPVVITVDLGKAQPIRGASFNTAAGVAGVECPIAIDILVSDDGMAFHHAGDLITLSQKQRPPVTGKYAVHRYWTGDMKTHGRYVGFVISAATFCFVDELEIYRGDDAWLAEPLPGRTFTSPHAFHQTTCVRRAVARRIERDIDAVRAMLDANAPQREHLLADLDRIGSQVAGLPDPPESFRATLPLNDLHRQVFAVRAAIELKGDGSNDLLLFPTSNHDPLWYLNRRRADLPALERIEVSMMQNEHRAVSFGLLPLTIEEVGIGIHDLPGGDNPKWIEVQKVQWTDTRIGNPVASALLPVAFQSGHHVIPLTRGLCQQVWLSINSADLSSGKHKGVIRIAGPGGAFRREIPLIINVAPIRFPDRPTLHLGGWDYTDANSRGITDANRDAVIAHLREYFVDSPWATSGVMPQGRHGADGRMTEPPDTSRFDAWIKRWPDARQYCVFAAVPAAFGKFEPGSAQFDAAVADWIGFWAKHAKKRNIDPKQLALLLVDEPHGPDQDAQILAWARAIRAANSGIVIWEDPTHQNPYTASQEMLVSCDVLCPNRPMFLASQAYRNYYAKDRPRNTSLAFYSCSGPVRSLDPYTYHRLQAWTCFQQGAGAMYFWAFGDTGGGSSWNEYAAGGNGYCPSFLDPTGVTTSRHMEAIREGIEDFEYLVMLKNAVADACAKGSKSADVAAAGKLLVEAPARVLGAKGANEIQWAVDKNRDIADEARVEILGMLVKLTSPASSK